MQWLMLAIWIVLTMVGARTKAHALIMRIMITVGLILSMGCQLWLLKLDGQLNINTGLPLHLCGAFAVMSVPLLWFGWQWLLDLSLLLGAPCALLALVYPAVIGSSQPTLMFLAFSRLHVLILCAPLLLVSEGKPLPINAHRAFVFGNGYLLVISIVNRMLKTNYLFMRVAPSGTPLAVFFAQGNLFYVCAIEILCILLLSFLSGLYQMLSRRSVPPILGNT